MTVALEFSHVDVFSEVPFEGNGLIVLFGDPRRFSATALRTITAEMRQMESILIKRASDSCTVMARIFTADEELAFAGHPVIGAAAVLHGRYAAHESSVRWSFEIAGREIAVHSHRNADYYRAEMNQGPAMLGPPLEPHQARLIGHALGLDDVDLHQLPMQVVSTGLPYLIVPVSSALARARIGTEEFETLLATVGAKFVYVFDPGRREGRSWDNAGRLEDIATGSAAGPAAAYLIAHGLLGATERVTISQGQYVGRPSSIAVAPDTSGNLWVGGPVSQVAHGIVNLPLEVDDGAA